MPEPSDLIGPYRLVSQLGKGAMGEVWRARDERLDRYVALKVLPAELAADPERRARMLREARAAAAIRHANVVTLYDIVEHAGGDILVMELVEGRTVSDVLRKDGAPSLDVALRWIEELADALVAAHARRILHRDIKSANVMITADAHIKVLDFGLAKLHDGEAAQITIPPKPRASSAIDATLPSGFDATTSPTSYETHAGTLLGTPLYMAPEQIAGSPPDECSEVFSVGVLAYELLAGKPPYSATEMDALFDQILKLPAPPLAKVPDSVDAIVQRALAKEAADRYPTMLALRDAVAAERRRLFSPRMRRWPFAVVALVLAIAAIAWWRTRPAPERPGDVYVSRALEEYDVFYNEKALSSLRAALRVAPDHPRANAYMILFGGAPAEDRAAAIAAAQPRTTLGPRITARIARSSMRRSPTPSVVPRRLESPWSVRVHRTIASSRSGLRSSTIARATSSPRMINIGRCLRSRRPNFAVASTIITRRSCSISTSPPRPFASARSTATHSPAKPTPSASTRPPWPPRVSSRCRRSDLRRKTRCRLNEGEDTLAGLAKVLAMRSTSPTDASFTRALELYQRALDRAGPTRRPLRRAALGFLEWIKGDTAAARATVAPCLPGGADSAASERGMCLFVAGVIDPANADAIAAQLDALAATAVETKPAYGAPASLAALVRARAHFFGGGCVVDPSREPAVTGAVDEAAYSAPLDFYGAYHIPMFATWALCEHAALLASRGDRAGAAGLLDPVATRAPNRTWLLDALKRYEAQ